MAPRSYDYDKGAEPVPGYRLTDYLGGGTFGQVWKTIDLSTSKHFALKIIDLSYSSSALKELRALKLVMNLNHPNLVPITKAWLKDKHGQSLDLHTVDLVRQKGKLKLLLILMGLGEKSLNARLKECNPNDDDEEGAKHGIPAAELTNYMLGAARGIDYLNAARHAGVDAAFDGPIIHCDIKPDNMMVVAGTEVQIADCGVAVSLNQDTRKTVSAAFSPVYAPPELATNKPSTGTDQYSLAISYYELRTGRRPFADGMNQLEMMTAHSLGDLDLSSPTLTPGERKVLKWATSPRIAERYPTCLDMVKQLERAIEGMPPRSPSDVPQKSAPVVLVPYAETPAPAPYPGHRPADPSSTQEHNIDLFLPPPTLRGVSSGSEPFVAMQPAAKAPGSRPAILINRDDPTGGELPEPELDPELQEIIRGSQRVAHPPSRPVSEAPAAPSLAPARPPAITDLYETVIRLDTDPAPVEGERPKPAVAPRPSRYDGTIVPGHAARPESPIGRPRPQVLDANGWQGKPVGGKKSSAPLVGVAVGLALLVGGGGVAAYVLSSAGGTATTAKATEPTTASGTTEPTGVTKPTEPGTKATQPGNVSPPTTISPPPPSAREAFDKQLAALSPPYVNNAGLVKLFEAAGNDSSFKAALLAKLVADRSRFAELADFATTSDKWNDFDDRRADLADDWYEAHLRAPFDEALAGVQVTPYAAAGKLASLRDALALPTAVKLASVAPAKVTGVRKFAALATAWEDAKTALPEFAKELTVADAPPAGKFFAEEYFKLARAQKVNTEELRSFRDKTKLWSGIDSSFQAALAEDVQAALLVENPKWAAIVKTCDVDAANGWKALAAAEEQLRTAQDGSAKLPRLPEMADAAGKQFARYLTNCASQDPDGLVDLYKDAKTLTPLLGLKSRKINAAAIVLKGTPLQKAHRDWATDPVKHLFSNPYNAQTDLDTQAARLETATRLSGALKSAHRMHRYLISVAQKAPDKALTVGLKVGESSVADEHRAAALAYSMAVFGDETFDNSARIKAAAAAARLAFQRLEDSFADCVTDKETNERQAAIATRIQVDVTQPALALLGNAGGHDAESIRFSTLRADYILKKTSAAEVVPKLEQLIAGPAPIQQSPDAAAAYGLLAMSRFLAYSALDGEKTLAKWEAIKGDAAKAVELDRTSSYGSIVLSYVQTCEFQPDGTLSYGIKPPPEVGPITEANVESAISQFEKTVTNLRDRKVPTIHYMRSRVLQSRAEQLSKSGGDEALVKELRRVARDAEKLGEAQTHKAEPKSP